MTWAERPFLAVDTETTGVNPFEDRIVSVATVMINDEDVVNDSAEYLIDPGVEIPEAASNIHGITTARAQAEGMPTGEALAAVASTISAATANGFPVVIYNAAFDWPLLLAEADRHGVDFPAAAAILDPFLLDKMVDRYRKGGRKLIDVAGHYGVDLDEADAHGALADATAAGRVMRALLRQHPAIAGHPLAGVVLRQTLGAEQQRQSFVDYMRRTKDQGFDKPAGWPIPCEPERRAS